MHRDKIIEKLIKFLDPERFEHSLRVEKIALALGKRWKVSRDKIIPAALLHDCARRYSRAGLLRKARKLGLKLDPVRKLEPKLFHMEIGALLAKSEFGITSPQVLQAIRLHTTGAAKMSKLDKIIFLADHIEVGRNYPGLNKIKRIAFRDLDQAILETTSAMLSYLIAHRLPIYPETVSTRNSLL